MTDLLGELKVQVEEIRDRHSTLQPDQAFVAWFLQAIVPESANEDQSISDALTGGSGDKNLDAIYIAHEPKTVFLVQGKYQLRGRPAPEKRSDLVAFAQLAQPFLGRSESAFDQLVEAADPRIQRLMRRARARLDKDNFALQLYYVTTGRVSENLREDAARVAPTRLASFRVLDRADILRLLRDYVQGAAPPVPSLDLKFEGPMSLNREDPEAAISSWVFTMRCADLGKLYSRYKLRLFSRNVRGFLGEETPVNRAMRDTLKKEPDRFWYFNNGVTIVCDEAELKSVHGQTFLRVENAQIINGQQTTRVLSGIREEKATVVVKLLAIERATERSHAQYRKLIDDIVKATNFQNAISSADLRSNDEKQVRLERELRLLGYFYGRKRQAKREMALVMGSRRPRILTKEVLARAVAACTLKPEFWRGGQRRLFDDDFYDKVFPAGRSADEYLTYFWLHKIIRQCSKGDIRKGYAVYTVLYFLWNDIGDRLQRDRARFRYVAERDRTYGSLLADLQGVGRGMLDAAIRLFQRDHTGLGIADESTFFRRPGVEDAFATYWRSRGNPARRRVQTRAERFFDALENPTA